MSGMAEEVIFKWGKKYRVSITKDKESQSNGHPNENKSKDSWYLCLSSSSFCTFWFVYLTLLYCWQLKETRDLQHVTLEKTVAASSFSVYLIMVTFYERKRQLNFIHSLRLIDNCWVSISYSGDLPAVSTSRIK